MTTPEKPAPEVTTSRLAGRYQADDDGLYRVRSDGPNRILREQIATARMAITANLVTDVGEPCPVDGADEHDDDDPPVVTHHDITITPPPAGRGGRRLSVVRPEDPTPPPAGPIVLRNVKHEDFKDLSFLQRAEIAPLGILTDPTQTGQRDVRNAITQTSPALANVRLYRRLGWHHRDGRYLYVHGNGAIGAQGAIDGVRVAGGDLRAYSLPPAPENPSEGRTAADAVWQIFDFAPARAAGVELGAAFRAAMGGASGSVTYDANNQAGKSAHAAFVSQMFAPSVRWNFFMFSATKQGFSAPYLEDVHHVFGDSLVTWDDLPPVGSEVERAERLDSILRSLFGRTRRGRSQLNGERRKGKPPRCMGIVTAERPVGVESTLNRTIQIDLDPSELDAAAFKAADQNGGPNLRASYMAAFIQWWAARMPAHAEVQQREDAMARALMTDVPDAPDRYIGMAASVAAGLQAGIEFGRTAEWLDADRAADLWARGWAGICETLRSQIDTNAGRRTGQRTYRAILDALQTGRAHVLAVEGGQPLAHLAELGWRNEGGFSGQQWRPCGPQIGWADNERLYLVPDAATSVVREFTARAGDPINQPSRALGEALYVERITRGYVERRSDGGVTTRRTYPKTIAGSKKSVWSMPYRDDTPPPGGVEPADADPAAPELPAPAAPASPPTPAAPAVEPAPAPMDTAAAGELPTGPALALGCSADRVYLGDGRTVQPGPAYEDMAALLDLARTHMPTGGTLAIDADVMAAIGYPERPAYVPGAKPRKSKRAPEGSRAVTDATAAGWQTSASGIGAWTVYHGDDRPSYAVVALPWARHDLVKISGAPFVTSDDDVMTAAALLARYREITGVPFTMTAGTTGLDMIRREYTRRPAGRGRRTPRWKYDPYADQALPIHGAPTIEPDLHWSRPLTEDEQAMPRVIGIDATAAYLAAQIVAPYAVDALHRAEDDRPVFDPARAGYWHIPADAPDVRPDDRCPPIAAGGGWVATPRAALLVELGMPADVFDDAVLAPAGDARHPGSVRLLHGSPNAPGIGERIRDGITAIPRNTPDPEEARVRAALKSTYTEMNGMMRRGSAFVHRPDWADATTGTATANLIRKVIGEGDPEKGSGLWPFHIDVDCLYYATDAMGSDEFVRQLRHLKVISDPTMWRLGTFTVKHFGPLPEFMEAHGGA